MLIYEEGVYDVNLKVLDKYDKESKKLATVIDI